MLAKTIDAGLSRTAAERKTDERILVQIRGERLCSTESPLSQSVLLQLYKYVTRETKDQSESERSVSAYEKSYDVFFKK